MANLITEHWNRPEPELPGLDCIAYPDGRVTILEAYSIENSATGERKLYCRPVGDSTIDSIEGYDAAWWTGIDEWGYLDGVGVRYTCGSGGMGNEGYVACQDASGGLVWGMFFNFSNPLRSLELDGNHLVATNEHNELLIRIDLENLTSIERIVVGRGRDH